MTPPDAQPPAYDLEQLGWLQFERLCSLVLDVEAGLTDVAWVGHADEGRVATLETRLDLPTSSIQWPGPTMLGVLWVRAQSDSESRYRAFADRLAKLAAERGDVEQRILALTNLDAGRAQAAAARERIGPSRLVVLGPSELGERLNRRPRLRAALPSVLGLCDLTPLIDAAVRDRSTFDVERAQELARVFSPTRAFDRTRAVLERHRFAVLAGPPEMGKTAIARMVGLAQLTDGWEAHECSTPDGVWRAFNPNRSQVFIADDAFGSTEYRPDAAERWAHELGRLLRVLDDRHWLIWTSRPAPLKSGLGRVQRERGSERFPAPGEILVDAGDLDLAEKTLILFRHAKNLRTSRDLRGLIRSTGQEIVEHPHFTPERIRRLLSDRRAELLELAADRRPLRRPDGAPAFTTPTPDPRNPQPLLGPLGWRRLVERELTTPTEAMRRSFRALGPEHRGLLVAMLDAPAGFVDERSLTATLRRHRAGALRAHPGQLIDRLTDHFIRVTPLGIDWVHPSWRDLVIDELRDQPAGRRRFLDACSVHGAMLAVSVAGGRDGRRAFPLLITDADWDALADRVRTLARELDDHDVARLLHAIGDMLTDELDPTRRAEALSLAEYSLDATRRAWDSCGRIIPLPALDAWYVANSRLPTARQPPQLAMTWAEQHPISGSPTTRTDLARADEWLALIQLVRRRDPAALVELGFPEREGPTLGALIRAAEGTAGRPDEQLGALAESILARIRSLAPILDSATRRARGKLALETVRRDAWWTPTDLDAPPSDEPATRTPDQFAASDIARVLRDL